jgi:S-adenosylmethionine:tRNA ribosyltransferase-isomerase
MAGAPRASFPRNCLESQGRRLASAWYTSPWMGCALFDYTLPAARIAQEPSEPRDAARLLLVDRARRRWDDHVFRDLPALLRRGDCLVINESRVLPARLLGARAEDGAAIEVLLLQPLGDSRWEALVRPGRRCRPGTRILVGAGAATLTVVGESNDGTRTLEIGSPWPVPELLERCGLPPLPPYILRHAAPTPEDRERYQTVYARVSGSVAAPTAGLHFTASLLDAVRAAGVEVHALTLHVGPGTFRPIRGGEVFAHRMAPERVDIPPATAEAVSRARAEGRRVVAVGTTTTRALEWAMGDDGRVRGGPGDAELFIRPGHRYRAIDALVTNFHLPRTTLLLLVAAFAGSELLLDAYRHAIDADYRFYSYGDAMLVV